MTLRIITYTSGELRIDHHDKHEDVCKYGIGLGQIHPDMNPNGLINEVWWPEPLLPDTDESENEYEDLHAKYVNEILKINQKHQDELNGQGTSRSAYTDNYPTVTGRRFKRY